MAEDMTEQRQLIRLADISVVSVGEIRAGILRKVVMVNFDITIRDGYSRGAMDHLPPVTAFISSTESTSGVLPQVHRTDRMVVSLLFLVSLAAGAYADDVDARYAMNYVKDVLRESRRSDVGEMKLAALRDKMTVSPPLVTQYSDELGTRPDIQAVFAKVITQDLPRSWDEFDFWFRGDGKGWLRTYLVDDIFQSNEAKYRQDRRSAFERADTLIENGMTLLGALEDIGKADSLLQLRRAALNLLNKVSSSSDAKSLFGEEGRAVIAGCLPEISYRVDSAPDVFEPAAVGDIMDALKLIESSREKLPEKRLTPDLEVSVMILILGLPEHTRLGFLEDYLGVGRADELKRLEERCNGSGSAMLEYVIARNLHNVPDSIAYAQRDVALHGGLKGYVGKRHRPPSTGVVDAPESLTNESQGAVQIGPFKTGDILRGDGDELGLPPTSPTPGFPCLN